MNAANDKSGSRRPESVIEEFKSVLAASIAGNVQVAGRVRDLLLAAAAPSRAGPGEDASSRVDESATMGRILDFTLASVRLLTESSLMFLNGILDQAEAHLGNHSSVHRAAPPGASGAAPAATAASVEILLRGARGERASAAFLLENKYDRSIDVSFEMGDFSADGTPRISGALVIVEPEAITMPPRGQAVIRLGLTVGDMFSPGTSYVGHLRTAGIETPPIRVRIEVANDVRAVAAPVRGEAATAEAATPEAARAEAATGAAARASANGVPPPSAAAEPAAAPKPAQTPLLPKRSAPKRPRRTRPRSG